MVVRELEGDMARQAAKKTNDFNMLRTLDCFTEGVCFVDISSEKWQALHSNNALIEVRLCTALHCMYPITYIFRRAYDIDNRSRMMQW